MRNLSIVIPCFNEAPVLRETHRRLSAVFCPAGAPVEFLFVDDGSKDQTFATLKELAAADPRVRVIRLSRNFGHQAAVAAGLRCCVGEVAAVIDADLQDPPELIPEMLELMDREQSSVVYGQRSSRRGDGFLKKLTARTFYRLLNAMSDVKFPLDTGDFRLLDRRVIDVFNSLPERNKYIRGLISWIGFKQTAFRYARNPRFAGKTKYRPSRMLKLATDGLFSFSRKPLRLAVRTGLFSVVVALALAVWVVVIRLTAGSDTAAGWASIVVVTVFLGGVQLLSIGVLGEYIGSIFDETKRRPDYVVAETLNLSAETVDLTMPAACGGQGRGGCRDSSR